MSRSAVPCGLFHALLDLLARLPGLLLDPIDDLVQVVARIVHVAVGQLLELVVPAALELGARARICSLTRSSRPIAIPPPSNCLPRRFPCEA
jgi:hypothetical protein